MQAWICKNHQKSMRMNPVGTCARGEQHKCSYSYIASNKKQKIQTQYANLALQIFPTSVMFNFGHGVTDQFAEQDPDLLEKLEADTMDLDAGRCQPRCLPESCPVNQGMVRELWSWDELGLKQRYQ
jgi:hypothetical protein